MALSATEATLLAMAISKATDVALQYFNKQTETLTEEEMDALIKNEEQLTSSLVDEFNAL